MQKFKPYIDSSKKLAELTVVPVILGCLLGVLFAASSLYLTLKVGITASASIPIAVMSITIFRAFSKTFGIRKATILENNIVQTTGSASEVLAFAVGITMTPLLLMGHEIEIWRVMLVTILGGFLGILMMIPLRKSLIVEEHENLSYPEGTACAEVLIVGEEGGTSAKTVFTGLGIGILYKFLNSAMKLWQEAPTKVYTWYKGSYVSAEISPELLGVGFIIGPKIAAIMFAGGVFSSWLLIPAIKLFGDQLTAPIFPATKLISEMGPMEVWKNYIVYIGAGAVTAAGIISLVRNLPMIARVAKSSFASVKLTGSNDKTPRTDRDIPMPYVFAGCMILIALISIIPALHMNLVGSVLILVLGFLFVAVSSRITGQVGSSSNPVSGMAIAALLITSLIFLFLGWTSPEYRVIALTVAAIVCVAICNAGATSQDLKTGFLIGATPKYQQIAIMIGTAASAMVIGYTVNILNDSATIYSKTAVPPGITVPNVAELTMMERPKGLEWSSDPKQYHVLRLPEQPSEGPLMQLQAGKYLVDDAGFVTYFVDPGINGTLKARDNGVEVRKFMAPKARLMNLIIDGILTQKLPWGLVLLGVAIAVIMELLGVPSLVFAVGVYLPMASSAPIFMGGVVRWLAQKFAERNSKTKEKEDDDSSPGILYASGLIAGGSVCGVLIAFLNFDEALFAKLDLSSKFPALAASNLAALLIFGALMYSLFRVGKRKS
jgi:putative OPT family oligopeptide transporter